jgi:hypothetical protein
MSVWFQLAKVSASLGDLLLMRQALEHCVDPSKVYWPAIRLYFIVLLALKDYYACLHVVLATLQLHPHFPTGIALVKYIVSIRPDFLYCEPQIRSYMDSSANVTENLNELLLEVKDLQLKDKAISSVSILPISCCVPSNLKCISFEGLGKFLLSAIKHCQSSKIARKPSLITNISLYHVLEESKMEDSQFPVDALSMANPKGKEKEMAEKKRCLQFDPSSVALHIPKRRSTRVKTKDKGHQNYYKLLFKYIPPTFSLRELSGVNELNPLIDKMQSKRPKVEQNAVHEVFEREMELVIGFLKSNYDNNGIIQLIFDYLWFLIEQFNVKLSSFDNLVLTFIDCYEIIHQHLNYPSPFLPIGEDEYSKKLYSIALCYLELKIASLNKHQSSLSQQLSNLPSCFNQCLVYIQCQSVDEVTLTLRVNYFKGNWLLLHNKKQDALGLFKQCNDLMLLCENTDNAICLPGTSNPLETLADKIQSLEQLVSLEKVKTSYENKQFEEVIEILLSMAVSESYSEVASQGYCLCH